MINCFITSHKNRSKEREYFLGLTQLALHANGFDSTIVEKPMLERYFHCEFLSDSPIYILCDDDIVPATPTTLKELVEILKKHPEYSQLGLGWKSNMQSEESSPWIRNKEGEIWEMDHVGGCVAVRRRTIKDLGHKAEANGYGDDKVMGKTARELGYKVGIVPHLYFHHLGESKSCANSQRT